MVDALGTYEDGAIPEVELGDDYFDIQPNTPVIPEGVMIFYIERYEAKKGTNKPSFGYNFFLVPYQDEYEVPVDSLVAQQKLKKYFYVGKIDPATNKIYEVAAGNWFQAFLASIDIGKTSEGKFKFSQDAVKGVLVRATVEHTKVLSNRENPNTGQIPTQIDDNDPYTYTMFAQLKDDLRGVRGTDGSVKRVNI